MLLLIAVKMMSLEYH